MVPNQQHQPSSVPPASVKSGIYIAVRLKPLTDDVTNSCIQIDDDGADSNTKLKLRNKTFTFDKIVDADASTGSLYDGACRHAITQTFQSTDCNVSVLAYGQTGAGKTHTINGMVPLMLRDLYTSSSSSPLPASPRNRPATSEGGVLSNVSALTSPSPTFAAGCYDQLSAVSGTSRPSSSHQPISLLDLYNNSQHSASSQPPSQHQQHHHQPSHPSTISRPSLSTPRTTSSASTHHAGYVVTAVEVYGDKVLDLLVNVRSALAASVALGKYNMGEGVLPAPAVIQVFETPDGGIETAATRVHVGSEDEASSIVEYANAQRSVAATAMNSGSSRSHSILTFHKTTTVPFSARGLSQNPTQRGAAAPPVAKLQIVDLAGSERQKKTNNGGQRFKESVAINQGLLALGNVIRALAQADDQRRQYEKLIKELPTTTTNGILRKTAAAPVPPSAAHIPYRASKLTRLLQDTLSPHTRTVFIACVSQDVDNADESIRTLQYSAKAMKITQVPRAMSSSPIYSRHQGRGAGDRASSMPPHGTTTPDVMCCRCGGAGGDDSYQHRFGGNGGGGTPPQELRRRCQDQLVMIEEQEVEIQLLHNQKEEVMEELVSARELLEDERVHYDRLLETLESEKTINEGRLHEKERTTSRLEAALIDLKDELSQDEKVFSRLTESLHTSKRDNKKLQDVITVLRNEVEEAKSKRATLEVNIERLSGRLTTLETERQHLKSEQMSLRSKAAAAVARQPQRPSVAEIATSTTSLNLRVRPTTSGTNGGGRLASSRREAQTTTTTRQVYNPPPTLPIAASSRHILPTSSTTRPTPLELKDIDHQQNASPDPSYPIGAILSPSPLTNVSNNIIDDDDDYHCNSSRNLAIQTEILVRQLEEDDEVLCPQSCATSEVDYHEVPQNNKDHNAKAATGKVSTSAAAAVVSPSRAARHMYSSAYYNEHPTRSPVSNREQLAKLGEHTSSSGGGEDTSRTLMTSGGVSAENNSRNSARISQPSSGGAVVHRHQGGASQHPLVPRISIPIKGGPTSIPAHHTARALFDEVAENDVELGAVAYYESSEAHHSQSTESLHHNHADPKPYTFHTGRSNRQEAITYPSLRPPTTAASSCTAAPHGTTHLLPRPSTNGGASSKGPRSATKVQLFNSTSTLRESLESEFLGLYKRPSDSLYSDTRQPPPQPEEQRPQHQHPRRISVAPAGGGVIVDTTFSRPPLRPLPQGKAHTPCANLPQEHPQYPVPPAPPASTQPKPTTNTNTTAPQHHHDRHQHEKKVTVNNKKSVPTTTATATTSPQPRKGGETLVDYIKKWDVENVSSFGGMGGTEDSRLESRDSSERFSVHYNATSSSQQHHHNHQGRIGNSQEAAEVQHQYTTSSSAHHKQQQYQLWGNPFHATSPSLHPPPSQQHNTLRTSTERSAELAEENRALRQQLAAIQKQLF